MNKQIPNDTEADDLSKLWQSQPAHTVDINEIKRQANSQKIKQRVYMASDILSLTPFLLFVFVDLNLSLVLKIFIGFVFLSSLIMVGYFVKLRWQGAFGNAQDTNKYVSSLIKQYKNNALIAQINKHVGWMVTPLAIGAMTYVHVVERANVDEKIDNILISSAFITLFSVIWCIWAHKRQKRFEKQANDLLGQF
ncbi:hypothetical protein PN836_000315 [Ningiella sp. W23]|uniref:hypothetical protein n=1 Tax=Ningiella sp. W23 TaxID=3023715 RepID=UPI00375759D3